MSSTAQPPPPPREPVVVPPQLARKRRRFRVLSTLFALALGIVMLSAAASAGWWLDTVLLGLGGLVITGFAILWQAQLFARTRNVVIVLLKLACSPLTIYPLGALILLRFLLFPSDDLSQGVGIGAGILFLSPIILLLAIAMMFVLGKQR